MIYELAFCAESHIETKAIASRSQEHFDAFEQQYPDIIIRAAEKSKITKSDLNENKISKKSKATEYLPNYVTEFMQKLQSPFTLAHSESVCCFPLN